MDVTAAFLSGGLGGLIVTIISVIYARKNLKRNKYIETITSERINWIQNVRNDFNTLISAIIIHSKNTDYLTDLRDEKISWDLTEQYCCPTDTDVGLQQYAKLNYNIVSIENAMEKTLTRSEIASKALLIKLKLNPEEDVNIIKDLDWIINFCSDYSQEMGKINIDFNRIVENVQHLLKEEWNKVKNEVEWKKEKRKH